MKQIKLIPLLDASDFPKEVDNEMANHDVSTHYNGDTINIEWEEETWLETKKWLLETYGEDIKNYDKFAIYPT